MKTNFLKKISPMFTGKSFFLPIPTLSFQERQQQRLAFRNNRNLYGGMCAKTGKRMISMYHPDTSYTVYDQQERWGDGWNATDYAQEIDLSKTFTQQFGFLMQQVPRINLMNADHANSEYCNFCVHNKDSYLLATSGSNDGCYYCDRIFDCISCCDCLGLNKCDLCYACSFCNDCFQCLWSVNLTNCHDCLGSIDLHGCSDCFCCSKLHNAQYCIFNEQYTSAKYAEKIGILKRQFLENPYSFLGRLDGAGDYLIQCQNTTGKNLSNCQNCTGCYASKHLEDCARVTNASQLQDCQDIDYNDNSQLNYQVVGGESNYHCSFCDICRFGKELWYCSLCMYCEHCFGCVGLKNKSYCIFNKQYTPEEYEKRVAGLVSHIQKTGEWGIFFAPSVSPFAYNETVAHDIYPLSQQEAIEHGYVWLEETEKPMTQRTILQADSLPSIDEVNDDIIDNAIVCITTGKYFNITLQELQLYRKLGVPLPTMHPSGRSAERLQYIM